VGVGRRWSAQASNARESSNWRSSGMLG
jgi:hypothetical protein